MVMRSLRRKHPRLLPNLARLESATIHILPTDLPYGFELTVGREPPAASVGRTDLRRQIDCGRCIGKYERRFAHDLPGRHRCVADP